jgi:hypothetical protein
MRLAIAGHIGLNGNGMVQVWDMQTGKLLSSWNKAIRGPSFNDLIYSPVVDG